MARDAFTDSNTQLVAHNGATGGLSIEGAAASGKDHEDDHEACTICLQPISERAVAVPCNHLTFDFLCLVSWLQERATCPLCNADVTEVQYDWRSEKDYKTFHVPQVRTRSAVTAEPRLAASRSGQRRRRVERWTPEDLTSSREDPSLTRRRQIYRDGLYSLHVGVSPYTGHRSISANSFSTSMELQSRARAFLRRELKVFNYLDDPDISRGRSRDYFIEYIVFIRRFHEPKGADGRAEDLVAAFLGRKNATLLLHELEAWLKSPLERLAEWDEVVQYKDLEAFRTVKGGD
ncbi:ring finger domain protein [Teratosphaeria destructans]|uniref:RING-type E3 ubiquitin transferase n=1 Tax=Teratosphaeria destructans TaxID=418781 RepID=A0A9W7SKK8_9PEZI|nr:ring finger domain protein [Teratosphaeria destructans]